MLQSGLRYLRVCPAPRIMKRESMIIRLAISYERITLGNPTATQPSQSGVRSEKPIPVLGRPVSFLCPMGKPRRFTLGLFETFLNSKCDRNTMKLSWSFRLAYRALSLGEPDCPTRAQLLLLATCFDRRRRKHHRRGVQRFKGTGSSKLDIGLCCISPNNSSWILNKPKYLAKHASTCTL